jgi:methyl-accepting chemotaxis protein
MYKFLVKLAILVLGIYLLLQIPFFQSYGKAIVDSFNQKVGNVTKEVNRVKGQVDQTKNKIDQTKQAVDSMAADIVNTGKNVEDKLTTAKKAIDSVSSALNGQVAPTPVAPPTDQKPAVTTK